MAAVLSSDMDNTDKIVSLVSECQRMQLDFILPHVNTSDYYFTVNQKSDFLYGLGAIKGIGWNAVECILKERKKNGIFQDLYDFCLRIDLRKVNKRICESLIYAGAMDGFAKDRQTLFALLNNTMKLAEQKHQVKSSGQIDLFNENDHSREYDITHIKVPVWSVRKKLIFEKSVLGMFLSGHLIDEEKKWIRYFNIPKINHITHSMRGKSVTIAGVVVNIIKRKTKTGKLIGIFQIDDGSKRLDLVVFNELYDIVKNSILVDDVIIAEGKINIDMYNDQLRLHALAINTIEEYVNENVTSFHLSCKFSKLGKLYTTLNQIIDDSKKSKNRKIKLIINVDAPKYNFQITSNLVSLNLYLLGDKLNMLEL